MSARDFVDLLNIAKTDVGKILSEYGRDCYNKGFICGKKESIEHYHAESYHQGLIDAWECARKINKMTMDDCEEVFGEYRYFGTVVENFTAAEAIDKVREYNARKLCTDKGCESCKYVENSALESPCVDCMRNHKDMWEAKE